MVRTNLIEDLSLLVPNWLPFKDASHGILEKVSFNKIYEEWEGQSVSVTAQASIKTDDSLEYAGFELLLGKGKEDVIPLTVEMEMPSAALYLILAAVMLDNNLSTTEELLQGAEDLGIELPHGGSDPNTPHIPNEPPNLADSLSFSIKDVHGRLKFPDVFLRIGKKVKDGDGNVIDIKPHPDDPRLEIPLGSISFTADAADGVSVETEGPGAVDLPPLMMRGNEMALDLDDVVFDFSGDSTPQAVKSAYGLPNEWRGFYAKKVKVWGMNSLLPFLPKKVEKNDRSANVSFSDWVIDSDGFRGDMTFQNTQSQDKIWQLNTISLGFHQEWFPTELSSEVKARLAKIDSDLDEIGNEGDVTLQSTLSYDPNAKPPARFGFDFAIKEQASDDHGIIDFKNDEVGDAAPAILGALSGFGFVTNNEAVGTVLAALAVLEVAHQLELLRFAVEQLHISYQARNKNGEWLRELAFELDLALEVKMSLDESIGDKVKINSPIGIRASTVKLTWVTNHNAVSADPLDLSWQMKRNLEISLKPEADIGNAITITEVRARLNDKKQFLLEFGIEASGTDEAAILPIPDAIVLVFNKQGKLIDIRAKPDMPFRLLVPGALYMEGNFQKGRGAIPLPEPEDPSLSWKDPLTASLRGMLVWQGDPPSDPKAYLNRENYMLNFDMSMISVGRSDGLKVLVVSLDSTIPTGIPLAQSGMSLYGIGLVYAQNAAPALQEGKDLAYWYMDQEKKFTANALKWKPAPHNWGFGASTVLGSAPDSGRSWNAKVGLFIMIPGPKIILAGQGNVFSTKPKLGPGASSTSLSAVIVLDLEHDTLTIDLEFEKKIPKDSGVLLDVNVPIEIFVNLDDAKDFHFYAGQHPKPKRVRAKSLGKFDISSYLMLSGNEIKDLPQIGTLPGLALAHGGEATVKWGFDASVLKVFIYASIRYHLALSADNPVLFMGLIEISGGLVAKAFGYGFDFEVFALLKGMYAQSNQSEVYHIAGKVGVKVNLPWPLSDVKVTVKMTFGNKGDLPAPPNPFDGLTYHPRREKKALQLLATDVGSNDQRLPIDPILSLSFNAPVGNEAASIGPSFNVNGSDKDHPVWKVVTTSDEKKNGNKRRVRRGYRYVISHLELRNLDTGQSVQDVPGVWEPDVVNGTASTSNGTASGNMPDRSTLQLLEFDSNKVQRYIGPAAKAAKEQFKEWDPCRIAKKRGAQRHHPEALDPGLLSTQTSIFDDNEPSIIRAKRISSGPRGSSLRRSQNIRMMNAHRMESPIADPRSVVEPVLKRQKPVLSIPQGLHFKLRVASNTQMLSNAIDEAELLLPTYQKATVYMLLANGVNVRVQGVVDGEVQPEPLDCTPVGESFNLHKTIDPDIETDYDWQVYTIETEGKMDALRFMASRAPSLPHVPPELESYAASILEVKLQTEQQPGSTGRDALTNFYSELLTDLKQGDPDGRLLDPDTQYQLIIKADAYHAEEIDHGEVQFGDLSSPVKTFTKKYEFETTDSPPTGLRTTKTPDGSRDNWDLATTPRHNGKYHYYEEDIGLWFRKALTLSIYEAHDKQLVLRLIDEDGNALSEKAKMQAQKALELPPEEKVWRDKLKETYCIDDDVDTLWRKASIRLSNLLEPDTQYQAQLHFVDKNNNSVNDIDFNDDIAIHQWVFSTSRYADLPMHLQEFVPLDEIAHNSVTISQLRQQAQSRGSKNSAHVGNTELDHLLHNTLRLPPRKSANPPELIRIWNWDSANNKVTFMGLLFDSPEFLLRENTPSINQNGSQIRGWWFTGQLGARVLFIPDTTPQTGQQITFNLNGESRTFDIPNHPSILSG